MLKHCSALQLQYVDTFFQANVQQSGLLLVPNSLYQNARQSMFHILYEWAMTDLSPYVEATWNAHIYVVHHGVKANSCPYISWKTQRPWHSLAYFE